MKVKTILSTFLCSSSQPQVSRCASSAFLGRQQFLKVKEKALVQGSFQRSVGKLMILCWACRCLLALPSCLKFGVFQNLRQLKSLISNDDTFCLSHLAPKYFWGPITLPSILNTPLRQIVTWCFWPGGSASSLLRVLPAEPSIPVRAFTQALDCSQYVVSPCVAVYF